MKGIIRYLYYRLKGSYIHPRVVIGKNVYIGSGCVIGYQAEHKKHWNTKTGYKVIIEDNVIINGMCSIDSGTVNDTTIKKGCFIMKQVHIGHDVILENNVTVAPHVTIGGHCHIWHDCNLGMACTIHQRVIVPKGCMIGMGAVITKSTEMWSDGVFIGNPAGFLRWNKVN